MVHSLSLPEGLSDAQLEQYWYKMLRVRMVEEAIADRYADQQMRCPTHLSIGQEAVPVIVCDGLSSEDKMLSTHRAHAHYLAKGGALAGLIAELHGRATGCSHGYGGSMHLIDLPAGFMGSTAIVGNSIPVGVGYALAEKIQKKNGIVVICVGDAATEEGVFYESVNFAVVKALPVLFLCENNRFSVYSDLSVRQPEGRSIADMVQAMGMQSQSGDGYDLASIYQSSRAAIQRIRAGEGPQFLEYQTCRWREHCGPSFDNELGYRSEEEFEAWKNRDLITVLEQHLQANKTDWSAIKAAVLGQIENEISNAFAEAITSPYPDYDADNKIYARCVG